MARIGKITLVSETTYLMWALGVTAVVAVGGYFLISTQSTPWTSARGDYTLDWGLLWAMSMLLYIVFSYRFWAPVKSNENAAVLVINRPVTNIGPGPVFAPLGFVTLAPVPSQVMQREFPAEPENIFRGEMKNETGLPEGMKPPVRIQFRNSITDDEAKRMFGFISETEPGDYTVTKSSFTDDAGFVHPEKKISFVSDVPNDGLSERVTAEPFPVIRMVIDDPALFNRNITTPEEAFKQLEDELFNVLGNYYTRMSVAQALVNMEWMAVHLKNAADRRVGARGNTKCWGVDIQAAYVKVIHTNKGLNTAISLKAQAPFERDTVMIAADGEREKRIKEGDGAGQAAFLLEKGKLEGRAAGYRQVAKDVGATKYGADVMAAETARSIGESGNTVIVGPRGISDLIGIATTAIAKGKAKPESKEAAKET